MAIQKWKLRAICLLVTWIASARCALAADNLYKTIREPFVVKTILLDWHDEQRNRDVPVRIYYPDAPPSLKFPIIIFSHGVGGSRNGYAYLGEFWAGSGYLCVHVQHVGSDSSIFQDLPPSEFVAAMYRATVSPRNIRNRPLDVTFTIDQLTKLNDDNPLFKGRLDLDHIGVAGHSFGAFTTLAVAGEVFTSTRGTKLAWPDVRVKAAIAMSETPPADPRTWGDAFAHITIPMLHLTGTIDESPFSESRGKAADRRVPFDQISPVADQFLITLAGGDHMVFSGRAQMGEPLAGPGNPALDPTFQLLVQQSTLAFWDGYLKSDSKAQDWLKNGGCKAMLGENAELETHLKKS
jgi:dienelactone hydrolase